ncbi:MAG: stage II sporulation protein D [Oscillospiraceae bacterium]
MKNVFKQSLFCAFLALFIPALMLTVFGKEQPTKTEYKVFNHITGETMTLTPKEYIMGVVAAEMPISFEEEAIKAQAVAANTYTLNLIGLANDNNTECILSTDSTICQSYKSIDELKQLWSDDFEENYKKLDKCVSQVLNKILTYDNKPIACAFHSLNSGITEDAKNVWHQDIPYLKPVSSKGDVLAETYKDTKIIPKVEVTNQLKSQFNGILLPINEDEWFNILSRTASGNISTIGIGNIKSSGIEIRKILNLKSANFTVSYKDENFYFETIGYGHGVGMSQYGANYMATQGKSYKDILLHYYKGASLQDINI